ncbi:hypothetical protein ACI3KS_00830 [Microbacterium sp. ZW T5_45]|uniref:hypothetical protein n=1 Tax=Microbacterium sp. ZW T5_45 TaxID=3378080 RepID=UPI00385442E2
MKNAIVRFVALYVFNAAMLLLIGILLPGVSVGIHALWAGVILTLAALFLKPLLRGAFRKAAARSESERTRLGEKTVQYALVYVVELIIWIATVVFSGVRAHGFWGFALPPLLLLVGWVIYDQVDDVIRAKTGEVYDTVRARVSGRTDAAAPGAERPADSPAAAEGRRELKDDGLTPEQRRLLDEL